MAKIPDETIREIRERVAILDLVSDYVSLKKSGANHQGLCPFHAEKTPSFSVNPAKGIFHCFGCGVGGDVFKFVEMIERSSFYEAAKFLSKRAGVVIEERPLTPKEQQRRDEREELYRITDLSARFYRSLLLSGDEGASCRQYLEQRGVDPETSETYRLGFAPGRWDALCRYLERNGVPLARAEKLGLVRRREGGSGYYDLFRNRLLFVIADIHGRPIAFGGRVLDDSLPKYINSPESPIYHKGDVLFGLDIAKQPIREQGAVIVVEGYFDHLALHRAGVRNVAATCGTALTDEHVKLLRRYAGKIYTLFDADNAGRKATIKAMDLVLAEGIPTSVIELPAGDDPDSFVTVHGAGAFNQRVSQARPIFEHYFHHLLATEDAGSVEGKRKILAELLPCLRKISDQIQRRLYLSEIARVLGMDAAELRNDAGFGGGARTAAAPSRGAGCSGKDSAEMLLALMASYPELAARAVERGVAALLPVELAPVAEAIIAQSANSDRIDLGALLEGMQESGGHQRLAALFVNDAHLEDIDCQKAFDQCCAALERGALKDIKELARELARTDEGSPRYFELMKEIETLRNIKSQLL